MPHKKSVFSKIPKKKTCCSVQLLAAKVFGNNDLLTEILLCLPAKFLITVKLVSKQWRSLISSDSFARLHFANRRRPPEPQHLFILGLRLGIRLQYFLCDTTVKKLVRLRFPFANNVKILQSCNGLLLLGYGKFATGYMKYCVFNPTTMKWRHLDEGGHNLALYLLFDQSKSHHYRVVHFNRTNNRPSICFSEYDSATYTWSKAGETPDGEQRLSEGVSCNNHVYFIDACSHYYTPEEKLCKLPHSELYEFYTGMRDMKLYTVESNGRLHCVDLWATAENPSLDLYEMINGNDWIECLNCDLKSVVAAVANERSVKKVKMEFLGMIRGERVEDSEFLVHTPGRILIVRLAGKECEVIDDFRSQYIFHEDQVQFKFKDAHNFVHTLASV